MIAIQHCIEHFLNNQDSNCRIICDNKSCITTSTSSIFDSADYSKYAFVTQPRSLKDQCYRKLKIVEFQWARGHTGYGPNEGADSLVKQVDLPI